ncbi:MAG: hypothetical protein H7A23_23410 [Leptospiraceae bacterium]|nr:hypothetical protein [Leptospiraceae bacterium]MCP5497516.1 hypothetical protein [Leptospiraceae bacterium]
MRQIKTKLTKIAIIVVLFAISTVVYAQNYAPAPYTNVLNQGGYNSGADRGSFLVPTNPNDPRASIYLPPAPQARQRVLVFPPAPEYNTAPNFTVAPGYQYPMMPQQPQYMPQQNCGCR